MTPSGINDMGAPAPTPDLNPSAEPKPAGGMTVPIPLAALAEPDEKEAMVNPEQGDIVDGQFEGKIVSINGEMAMVSVTSVNGKPLDGSDKPPEGDANASTDDYGQLEQMAQQQDQP